MDQTPGGALHTRFNELFADDDARLRAIEGRDTRADGFFYYSVNGSRLYCRCACKAQAPSSANIRFFPDCETAEAKGYRACPHCRPDLASRPRFDDAFSVRPAAVMFVDIKGFSTLAASMRAEDALRLIDSFLRRLGAVVASYRGTIHKQLGDGFMAVFGDRVSKPSDARRAIEAAFDMHHVLSLWNLERIGHGWAPIAVGIGIDYGLIAFGYAVGERLIIGDTVNAASRIEAVTRRLNVSLAISDETMRALAAEDLSQIEARFTMTASVDLPGCGKRQVHGAVLPLLASQEIGADRPIDSSRVIDLHGARTSRQTALFAKQKISKYEFA